MNPAGRRWKTPRITTILVGMVVGVVAVVLCICILVFLATYRRAMVQTAVTNSAQAVSQVTTTVEDYLQGMNQTLELVISSMQQDYPSRKELLSALLEVRPEVVAITSYTDRGQMLACWALDRTPRETIHENLSFDAARVAEGAEFYITAPHVETIFEGYYPWVVTMAARMPGQGAADWVSLDLSFSNISSYINNVGIGPHGYCFLMDTEGNIIYHPQQQLLYSGLKSEETTRLKTLPDGSYVEDTCIYSLHSVGRSGWRVVGVSYVDEVVGRSVNRAMQLALLLAGVALGVALLASGLLSHLLGRPLRGLETAMENFEKDADHFSYRPVGGTREVQELSDSFGHMVERIQKLMSTVREEEVNLRKTELKALQAQINPHFLYNTLDSIAWMCERGRNADAVQMVHALARLFRISISKGHELIPIAKELEHAESYLQIQKYRYKNRFTYSFRVDESCTDYLCNKITLQPLIENAITHGLDLLVEEGKIEVEVCRDGADILLRVRDNGIGMDPEQVAALVSHEPSDRTGIGIKNVNDRLKIYFGEAYGLTVESEPDVGTCVTVRMPKLTGGQNDAASV